jgi:outer membrane protein assembly factor BamB
MVLVCIFTAAAFAEDNWPNWRGPNLNGSATATGLPLTWSETENIVWKSPLPSWSGASPVIWGDRVFVASPSKPTDPDENKGAGGSKLLLLCLSKIDGHILWEQELDSGHNEFKSKQNSASPSPVTDGMHVWAMTGTGVLTAHDMDGKIEWKRNLVEMYGPFGVQFGFATSPLLHDGKIIMQVLHGFKTDAPSYLAAFDGASGKLVWRIERPTPAIKESRDSYGTPCVASVGGKKFIVVSGGDAVTGHDPATGAELWRVGGLNPRNSDKNRIIVSPLFMGNMVYAVSARRPMLAIRLSAGDPAAMLMWKWDASEGPDVPNPVCDGKYFYLANDHGTFWCLDAKTGENVWGPERTAPGAVSASPVMADGKIYTTNEAGVTTVLAAAPEFRKLATNKLDCEGKLLASMAISGSQLFMRTPTHLYCIGKK